MLMKLSDSGSLLVDKSYLHDPPPDTVNGGSYCKGQVTQANPVVVESVSGSKRDCCD